MKPILTALLLIFSASTNAQGIAGRLFSPQSHPQPISAPNFLWVDTAIGGQTRIYVADPSSLRIYSYQVNGLLDTVYNWSDLRYVQLGGSYNDPDFIENLNANKVFGLSSVALDGQYSSLSGLPNLSLYYLNSNPNGYISSINRGLIVGALGYVPADSLALSGKLNISDTISKWLGLGYIPTWASISGKPTIPDAQVNSDWGAVSGVAQILNKPTIPTNTNQLTNGAGFITSVPAQTWASITGKPTFKRQLTFTGTTNASGVYSNTFTAFGSTPNIQANIVGGTPNKFITMTVTTTGFTCTVYQRNTVNLLSVEVLLGTTVLVNNATVHVLITEN